MTLADIAFWMEWNRELVEPALRGIKAGLAVCIVLSILQFFLTGGDDDFGTPTQH